MAHQRFKGALSSAVLPFVSTLQTRTVVMPQLDVNVRTPRNPNSPEGYTDYSIPQVLYCENAVPTTEGFQSVYYQEMLVGNSSGFDQAIVLRDADENNFLLSPANGRNFIYSPLGAASWVPQTALSLDPAKLITRAYVNGRTFVCFEGRGVWEYDTAAGTFNKQTLLGITDAEVRGIGNSSNYLLAFTQLEVHWSSLVDPLDFEPSLQTGAGFAIPQDVKARITAVLGIAGGYIVYTAKNAVAGVYTNNSRAPFTFKEVNNAGGIATYEQVTSEQNAGHHYAWTTSGLQRITIQGAEPISAEVNDFLAGRLWESYSFVTHTLTQTYANSPEFQVKLSYIASRWLLISYNVTPVLGNYQYALVYDTILKRWGKLKLDHVDVFSYPFASSYSPISYEELAPRSYAALAPSSYADLVSWEATDPQSKSSIALLQADGTIQLLQMTYNKDQPCESVLIFGKFQLTRASMMTLQELELESVWPGQDLGNPEYKVFASLSLNGKTPQPPVELALLDSVPGYSRHAKRMTGVNFNIIVEGTSALTAYVLEVNQSGDR
mgnify:CR=1 FL=1